MQLDDIGISGIVLIPAGALSPRRPAGSVKTRLRE
jgi:hypothetical protein